MNTASKIISEIVVVVLTYMLYHYVRDHEWWAFMVAWSGCVVVRNVGDFFEAYNAPDLKRMQKQ